MTAYFSEDRLGRDDPAFVRSGQPWRDDPATEVVDVMVGDISEHLGTDGPEETFGHPDESRVGHLVDDDEGGLLTETTDVLAYDTHDVEDLAAEELAMHYVDADSEEADQEDLADFADYQ